MSNFSGFSRRARIESSVPRGEVLASVNDYGDAQEIINRLAKAEFDVAGIAIVGRELTTVEMVRARLNYGRAALSGASGGAWLGLFFGLISTILSPISPQQIGIFFAAVLTGVGIGMIFGVINYSITRKRRDYAATSQLLAERYEVIIAPTLAAKARGVLGMTVVAQQAVAAPAEPAAQAAEEVQAAEPVAQFGEKVAQDAESSTEEAASASSSAEGAAQESETKGA